MTTADIRAAGEGLRERKKRLMRRQLADTAARMFMDRGFDAVKVAEVAEACGVSEKTVFNYFPTKEALVLDRLETMMSAVSSGLADPAVPPVQAMLRILDAEVAGFTESLDGHPDPAAQINGFRRFGELIRTTPALRTYQSSVLDRIVAAAAQTLAQRLGMRAEDPEPQIAATALLGLWRVQFASLSWHLDAGRTPAEIRQTVAADVRRAADLIDTGLAGLVAAPSVPAGR
ncbi:TetR family transcriptional regulator [Actinoplanes sp. NPDC049316]|uniref:TetR family transcriptional regulator n=1 Tax=Actinoplanes sp. NPDC049316 TaxID=3154727 RepID=UPI00344168C3